MSDALPGIIGGKYRVVRRLGEGGMGSVYEAVDAAGARVAVKVIQTSLANDSTLVGRFEREARTAAALDTPHIARTLDAGRDAQTGLPFLVMELLDGEDLAEIQKRVGVFPPEVALRVAAQACFALQKAHEAHILHRDIKPANLFLARHGGGRLVKLLDFGVAKVRPDVSQDKAQTAGLTRTGSMLGSPIYMSPEQARGYKDIDFRSDLWSLGVVLYKMLSGRAPHDDVEELGELIVVICTEPPPPIQDVAPWVPAEIATIVHRALRFSPSERYSSAVEMYGAIAALLPAGIGILDSMLRPISAAETAAVAPRLSANLNDVPPPRKSSQGSVTGSVSIPGPAISTLSVGAMGTGAYPPSSGVPSAGPPRSSVLPWIAVGVLGVLLGAGLGVARFTNLLGGAPGPAVAAPESKPRTVTVVILPPGARVEVEGAETALSEGILEITGVVGSVHKVRVAADGVEKSVRVVVSDSGAVPAKIELESAAAPAPTATAAASTPGVRPRPKAPPTSAPVPAADPLRNKR